LKQMWLFLDVLRVTVYQ